MRSTIERLASGLFPLAGRVLLSCLVWLLLASPTSAEDVQVDADLLRPADTSSPRDTLNGFLSDSSRYIEDFRQGLDRDKAYRAYRRASQALDFSTTAEGDTWFVRIERIALLQELLARIELPAQKEIPGDREVADGAITQWTIPKTQITIAKVQQGPRAGQFLFSADTVQALDRLYRQAKDLPYRPGATPGLYEQIVSADGAHAQEQVLRSRLKPVDTFSPRSTLETFLDSVNRAYALVTQANDSLRAAPPQMTRDDAREMETAATDLLRRASDTLDLSKVPPALRRDVSIEVVLQLKEIFDRMLLPPLDAVPNSRMVLADRKDANESTPKSAAPFRWRLPNTEIEIVEIRDGDRQGQFLFSADTVRRIGDVYRKIEDLPYRQAQFGGMELEYQSPGLSPGFYTHYISASGRLIPRAHLLGRVVDTLPTWFKTVYGGQLLWQWMAFFLCVLLTATVAYSAQRYIRLSATRVKSPLHDWLRVLVPIILLFFVVGAGRFIDDDLNFTGDLQAVVTTTVAIIVIFLAAWVAFVFCQAVAETIISSPRMRDRSSESALLRIGASVLGFLIAVWIIVDGIRALGADLLPLLAGLGIGGFAVALAAQSTIANFIGGLILLANKPVRVGDFCRYGEDPSSDWLRIGTVEEINWMSTRIRGIDRTVTTIPNAAFSTIHIVNFSRRDERLVKVTLQLRYETTPEQMRYVLARLRELLLGHPRVTSDPARVRFVGYGPYSKDVEIFCYLRCTEQNEFLAIQEDLLLRVEDIVKESGSGFAFPSQTAYLARDTGVDAEKAHEAEAAVDSWRSRGKLPFPEFEDEERERLEDILDYPPKGSPKYRPHGTAPRAAPDVTPQRGSDHPDGESQRP